MVVNGTPIQTRITPFREFEAHNRLENGTAAFLSVSMPVPDPPKP